jgi:DegV family protein with EDD domain
MSNSKIAIITDSTAYIPEEAQVGLNISVIPILLIWNNERLRDGVDIDPPTFYRRLKESKTLPTSSQPSPGEFEVLFKQVAAEADAIVSVLTSSKISGTVASALTAQAQLPELTIRVVDSLTGSMGMGLIVLAAARAAAAGKTLDEVVTVAAEMREKIHFLFMVDTLEYLHRSGRIKGAKRLLGTALNIKPLLHFQDGIIEFLTQVRTRGKAIERLLEIAEKRLAGKRMAEVAVVDIDCPDEGDKFAKTVADRFAISKIHRSTVSPVVGTIVGPGAMGFAFYGEK